MNREDFEVEGLTLLKYFRHGKCEAADYQTPSGTDIFVVRDALGVQIICKAGKFWPSVATFSSMQKAVACLRSRTDEAIEFFETICPEKV